MSAPIPGYKPREIFGGISATAPHRSMCSMRKLCDNPACPAHCDVVYRSITTDGEMGWCFANGGRASLTSDQLAGFHPASKLNVCSRCRGCYDHMLKRARQIAVRQRNFEPETLNHAPP